jgi:hypothetical protein
MQRRLREEGQGVGLLLVHGGDVGRRHHRPEQGQLVGPVLGSGSAPAPWRTRAPPGPGPGPSAAACPGARHPHPVGEPRRHLARAATLSLVIATLSRAARRRWWLWAGTFLASSALEQAVKFLVERPRPSGFSVGFPSGHTTAAAVFAVIALYLVSRECPRPTAGLPLQVAALAMMILVGWARIVLHAHWPTDVLGGFLLGTSCATAAIWWDISRPTAS